MQQFRPVEKILLVEDEKSLQDAIELNLRYEGYTVDVVGHGVEAVDLFRKNAYDLVLLDVMLPGQDGFEVCKQIREQDTRVPVIFLTAKNSDIDRITGLKIGGDDYLAKPFNLEELLLRVQKLIERGKPGPIEKPDTYKFADNVLNFRTFEATTFSGEVHRLTGREAGLLQLLIEKKNEVVPRDEILEKVWGYSSFPSTRTIDNFILAFRKYFEREPRNPKHFLSVRGVGYRFIP